MRHPDLPRPAREATRSVRQFLQAQNINPRQSFDPHVRQVRHELARTKLPPSEKRFIVLQMIRMKARRIVTNRSALSLLDTDLLVAIVLVDGAKCNHLEAARVSACTDEAVRSRARRARAALKKYKKK